MEEKELRGKEKKANSKQRKRRRKTSRGHKIKRGTRGNNEISKYKETNIKNKMKIKATEEKEKTWTQGKQESRRQK